MLILNPLSVSTTSALHILNMLKDYCLFHFFIYPSINDFNYNFFFIFTSNDISRPSSLLFARLRLPLMLDLPLFYPMPKLIWSDDFCVLTCDNIPANFVKCPCSYECDLDDWNCFRFSSAEVTYSMALLISDSVTLGCTSDSIYLISFCN